MKKSLLALAVLGAFAGAASAQSTVTLYGRVDLSVGKPAGLKDKRMANGSGSRFGVRGVEDLGGGLSAFFNLEHRYDADTGAQTNAQRFWAGRSLVGLQGGFGKLTLGREYTTAFLQSQLVADPWGWDTVVSGSGLAAGGSGGNSSITGGGIAKVRNDSSATYNFLAGGFNVGVQVAEATDTFTNVQKKPVNFAVSYGAGPITAGLAYERTGAEAAATEKWGTLNFAYDLGFVKPGFLIGKGTTAANADRTAFLLTATAPLGAGEFRASYGQLKQELAGVSTKLNKAFGVGYHYSLSKRTTLYADILNDRGDPFTTSKTGYDLGI
jgi:predicted porin